MDLNAAKKAEQVEEIIRQSKDLPLKFHQWEKVQALMERAWAAGYEEAMRG